MIYCKDKRGKRMLKSSNDIGFSFEAQRIALRGISADELRDFGVNHIAYIRPVSLMGNTAYAIHSADGTPLAAVETLDLALTAARQNDLEPVILQ